MVEVIAIIGIALVAELVYFTISRKSGGSSGGLGGGNRGDVDPRDVDEV